MSETVIRRLMALQVKFMNKGTTLVIKIPGELDHHCAEYVRRKIDAEMTKSTTKNLLFDFTNLSFMDSSGIGVILGRYGNIRKMNGKAAIVGANPQVSRILEMSGVLKLIPVYDNINAALDALKQ